MLQVYGHSDSSGPDTAVFPEILSLSERLSLGSGNEGIKFHLSFVLESPFLFFSSSGSSSSSPSKGETFLNQQKGALSFLIIRWQLRRHGRHARNTRRARRGEGTGRWDYAWRKGTRRRQREALATRWWRHSRDGREVR